jgi:hypothetical protein
MASQASVPIPASQPAENFSVGVRSGIELRLNCAFPTVSVALTKTREKPGVAL